MNFKKKYNGWHHCILHHVQATQPFAETQLYAVNETFYDLRKRMIERTFNPSEDHPSFIASFQFIVKPR